MTIAIFDFDSTLISIESLEYLLSHKFSNNPEIQKLIKKITEDGIRGKISFEESLEKRLSIGAPTKQDAAAFGAAAHQWLTPGIGELIQRLQEQSVDVWIISGALRESILSLGIKLGIPEEKIHGVRVLWDEEGKFSEIDKSNSFCRSKVEGVKSLAKKWTSPTIAIGDAVSDYRLFEEGIADYFIAFTEHFRCEEVLKKGVHEAKNAAQLQQIIDGIIKHHAIAKKR